MHTSNITVNANRIAGVQSNRFAHGIKVEQNKLHVGNASNVEVFPKVAEASLITNNIVRGVTVTDMSAHKAGIRLMTERESDDNFLEQDQGENFIAYTSRGDKVLNNTIIMEENDAMGINNGVVAGVMIQNTSSTEVYNNAIAVTDINIPTENQYAAAIVVQGLLPFEGGPSIDNNVYFVDKPMMDDEPVLDEGAMLVKYIEMDKETHSLKYEYDKYDYVNLEQWRIWTGSDRNSIESNFLVNYDLSDETNVTIAMEGGQYPIGSVLNNRGVKVDVVTRDVNMNKRGVTGQRYDIGAHEFKGRLYTSDMQMVRIESPASYKDAFQSNDEEHDFTNEEHIMAMSPINVSARVRNDGALLQAGIELSIAVERVDYLGENIEVLEDKTTITVPASDFGIAEFNLSDDMGDKFEPMTYAELIMMGEEYDMDAPEHRAYKGMEANVTPQYQITISNSADEDNSNNSFTKNVRFYIKKAEQDAMVSTVFNSEDYKVSADVDRVGGALNLDMLRDGLRAIDFKLDPVRGDFDYDLFDRTGWEPRAVNYDMYRTLLWVDGGDASNDEMTRIQSDELREFLADKPEVGKRNVIIASQDLARNNDMGDEDFNKEVLHVTYDGNPRGEGVEYVYADGVDDAELADQFKVDGTGITYEYEFDILNPTYINDNVDKDALNPMASAVKAYNGGHGLAKSAFTYRVKDEALYNYSPNMGVATSTLEYNMIYLGLDWRHIDEIETVMSGILDYLNNNDGYYYAIDDVEFNAELHGNAVRMDWKTENENGTSRFMVERTNATEAGTHTVEVANVEAAGTTLSEVYGPFVDGSIVGGNTYVYTLKSIDAAGNVAVYSDKSVEITVSGNLAIYQTNQGVVKFTTDKEATIEIFDNNGALVGTQEVNTNTGTVETSNLTNGAYHVRLTDGDNTVTGKIVIAD